MTDRDSERGGERKRMIFILKSWVEMKKIERWRKNEIRKKPQ